MAKMDKEGKLHRQEKSSRRKMTALSNSLLSQRDHTDRSAMCLVKTTGDTQILEPCLTGLTYSQCLPVHTSINRRTELRKRKHPIYSISPLLQSWVRHLSRDGPAYAGLLCVKANVFGGAITEMSSTIQVHSKQYAGGGSNTFTPAYRSILMDIYNEPEIKIHAKKSGSRTIPCASQIWCSLLPGPTNTLNFPALIRPTQSCVRVALLLRPHTVSESQRQNSLFFTWSTPYLNIFNKAHPATETYRDYTPWHLSSRPAKLQYTATQNVRNLSPFISLKCFSMLKSIQIVINANGHLVNL